jgi:hypothetical protein
VIEALVALAGLAAIVLVAAAWGDGIRYGQITCLWWARHGLRATVRSRR